MKPGWRIRRLTEGSALTARRLGRAFVPMDEEGEVRLIASAVRCSAGLWLGNGALGLAHQSPGWILGGAGLWCVSAWRVGAAKAQDAKEGNGAKAGEATEATVPVDEVDEQTEFLTLLHRLMPGTEPGKDDRIHLVQIAHEWADDGANTAPIRALLVEADIPITDCRVPGRGPSKGIYLRDVPPLPDSGRQPLSGVVAGSDQQQQQQQRSDVARREGFWTKPHPDQSNRSIIEWENAS